MEKRIYYHDTDAGGVVYYANYLKYMEEARVDFFHKNGLSEKAIANYPVFFPVRSCVITYNKPAWHGDTIQCTADIKKITPAKIIFQQHIIHKQTKNILVEAEVTLACVDAKDFKPMRIPEDVRTKLLSTNN
jgi:tol-pal system-associated acyl-CoA thioesterase